MEVLSFDDLRQEIITAFEHREYPGDDNLVIGGRNARGEPLLIGEALKGRRWQDLTLNEVGVHLYNLYALTTAAFQYYLPEFLIRCMNYYCDLENDELIRSLSPPPHSREKEDVFLARIQGLTYQEKIAIRDWFGLLPLIETNS
jgi:hypothetical protein